MSRWTKRRKVESQVKAHLEEIDLLNLEVVACTQPPDPVDTVPNSIEVGDGIHGDEISSGSVEENVNDTHSDEGLNSDINSGVSDISDSDEGRIHECFSRYTII